MIRIARNMTIVMLTLILPSICFGYDKNRKKVHSDDVRRVLFHLDLFKKCKFEDQLKCMDEERKNTLSAFNKISFKIDDSKSGQVIDLIQKLSSTTRYEIEHQKLHDLKKEIIKTYQLDFAPVEKVILKKSEFVYRKNCQGCHGATAKGDGLFGEYFASAPVIVPLQPYVSPLYCYHLSYFGHRKFGMPEYRTRIQDKDIWAACFYALSMNANHLQLKEKIEKDDRLESNVPLAKLSFKPKEIPTSLGSLTLSDFVFADAQRYELWRATLNKDFPKESDASLEHYLRYDFMDQTWLRK